jgi:response regulator of citrate/malate metabolism
MQKLKEILIVDDDDFCQLIHRVVIHKMEITERIILKSDGFQALLFLKEKYSRNGKLAPGSDLILLDIHMPIINGLDFLKALQVMNGEDFIGSTVILLSSSDDAQALQIANRYGVKGLIQKPLTRAKLLGVLEQDAIKI